jgi:hypothetical protein
MKQLDFVPLGGTCSPLAKIKSASACLVEQQARSRDDAGPTGPIEIDGDGVWILHCGVVVLHEKRPLTTVRFDVINVVRGYPQSHILGTGVPRRAWAF